MPPPVRFERLMQARWAPEFGVVATVVAATTDGMAFAWLDDFAVATTAVSLDYVDGSKRRTAVLARAVGDAVGACGVFAVGWGVGPRVVGAGAKGREGSMDAAITLVGGSPAVWAAVSGAEVGRNKKKNIEQ